MKQRMMFIVNSCIQEYENDPDRGQFMSEDELCKELGDRVMNYKIIYEETRRQVHQEATASATAAYSGSGSQTA